MWQIALAKAGIAGVNSYLSGSTQREIDAAQNRVDNAQARANNRVRAASNGFAAAKASLERFTQSVNNQYALEAMGQGIEANVVNAKRQDDELLVSSFDEAIRASEAMGAQAAAAAAAGQMGSAVDMVSAATAMQSARAAADVSKFRALSSYDAGVRSARIASSSIRGLDNSYVQTALDFNVDAQRFYNKGSPLRGAFWSAAQSLAESAMQGAFSGDGKGPSGGGGPGLTGAASNKAFASNGPSLGQSASSGKYRFGSAGMNNSTIRFGG